MKIPAKKRPPQRKQSQEYSEDFKWQVVQEVLSGKLSKAEANRIYGIRSKSAILYWMRQYSGITNYRESSKAFSSKESMKNKQEIIALEEKLHKLQDSLKRERNKSALYEKMLEIAEEEYGINIRKKYGAKQSKVLKKKSSKK
jgi:transposase-like protein